MDPMPEVVDGKPSETGMYLIKYNEHQWKRYDEEGQEFCKQQWLKKARVIPGVKSIVLQLIPDMFFPMYGNDKPYIVWQMRLEGGAERKYNISVYAFIDLPTNDMMLRNEALNDARKRGADRYRVTVGTRIVAEGKF